MPSFLQTFAQRLVDNIVLVLFLLPLVGAGLVGVSARLGVTAVRRTALTNALFTLAMAGLMIANYDSGRATETGHANATGHSNATGRSNNTVKPPLIQMRTSLRWLRDERFKLITHSTKDGQTRDLLVRNFKGPDVRISVGVDGVSLWFVALTAMVMVPAVLAGPRTEQEQPATFYVLLLLLQMALIGLFAALDIVLFCLCLEMMLVPLFILIGRWGGTQRRNILVRLFVFRLTGGLLVTLGLLALTLVHSWMRAGTSNPHPAPVFATHQLIDGLQLKKSDDPVPGIVSMITKSESAKESWYQAGGWIFLLLGVGFTMLTPVFPLHGWFGPSVAQTPSSVGILFSGVGLSVGCYGVVRFILPLFPEFCIGVSPILTAVAVLGMVFAGLLSLAHHDLKPVLAYALMGRIGLSVAGLCSLNTVALTASLFNLFSLGVSMAFFLYLLGRMKLERMPHGEGHADTFSGRPRLKFFCVLAVLAVIGVPGTGGFIAEAIGVLGIYQGIPGFSSRPLLALGAMFGLLLTAWAIVRSIATMFRGSAPSQSADDNDGSNEDLNRYDLAGLIPCVAIVVWMGLSPQTFISRIEPSITGLTQRIAKARSQLSHTEPVQPNRSLVFRSGMDETEKNKGTTDELSPAFGRNQ